MPLGRSRAVCASEPPGRRPACGRAEAFDLLADLQLVPDTKRGHLAVASHSAAEAN